MTAGTILLKPVLKSGRYSLSCMPDAILQHLLDGSLEQHNIEDNSIYLLRPEHYFFDRPTCARSHSVGELKLGICWFVCLVPDLQQSIFHVTK